jgi:hypothetical protein
MRTDPEGEVMRRIASKRRFPINWVSRLRVLSANQNSLSQREGVNMSRFRLSFLLSLALLFGARPILASTDASDKTAKQNESDDHFRLARHSATIVKVSGRPGPIG